jgi:N-acetyl-beta-hexosaminidase
MTPPASYTAGDKALAKEDLPFARSPVVAAFVAAGGVASAEALPSWFAGQVATIAARHGVPCMQAWQDGLKFAEGAADFTTAGLDSHGRHCHSTSTLSLAAIGR